jgi:hypothetical protein
MNIDRPDAPWSYLRNAFIHQSRSRSGGDRVAAATGLTSGARPRLGPRSCGSTSAATARPAAVGIHAEASSSLRAHRTGVDKIWSRPSPACSFTEQSRERPSPYRRMHRSQRDGGGRARSMIREFVQEPMNRPMSRTRYWLERHVGQRAPRPLVGASIAAGRNRSRRSRRPCRVRPHLTSIDVDHEPVEDGVVVGRQRALRAPPPTPRLRGAGVSSTRTSSRRAIIPAAPARSTCCRSSGGHRAADDRPTYSMTPTPPSVPSRPIAASTASFAMAPSGRSPTADTSSRLVLLQRLRRETCRLEVPMRTRGRRAPASGYASRTIVIPGCVTPSADHITMPSRPLPVAERTPTRSSAGAARAVPRARPSVSPDGATLWSSSR